VLYSGIVFFEFSESQTHPQMGIGVCFIEFKGDGVCLSRGLDIALAIGGGAQTDVGHGGLRRALCGVRVGFLRFGKSILIVETGAEADVAMRALGFGSDDLAIARFGFREIAIRKQVTRRLE
jgi:hypothetical protein